MKDISKAKGGYALANKMTHEEKKEKAEKMLEAKRKRKELPSSKHEGQLNIGGTLLDVAVLSNDKRVITQSAVFKALDRPARGNSRVIDTPVFMDAKNLQPFIDKDLREVINKIEYIDKKGKILAGYDASILPLVCELYLKAREAGAITKTNQLNTAHKAEILMRGLARVGIIALIDETTGYEKEREKNSLAKILEAFVAKELQPWLKTFPDEYYSNLFRLWSIPYPPKNNVHYKPSFFGHITNNIVYARLAPELLPELKKSAKTLEKKTKLHQWLTGNVGHPKLREHLSSITTLLKISSSKEEFLELVDKVHPKFTEQYELDFNSK